MAVAVGAVILLILIVAIANSDKPSAASNTSTTTTASYTTSDYSDSTTTTEPTTTTPPPPARVGDCVTVSSIGGLQGVGSCDPPQGIYEVNSVEYHGSCVDPESPSITEDGYRLCLTLHLVRNYCYTFPQGPGWVTGSECRVPGSVYIVDIVPGATNGSKCTRRYQWNWWYPGTHPQAVYCVMRY